MNSLAILSTYILDIDRGAYVSEIRARQYGFLATIINAETSKVSILYSLLLYTVSSPGRAHAVMGFLNAAQKSVVEKTSLRKDRHIMGNEVGGA